MARQAKTDRWAKLATSRWSDQVAKKWHSYEKSIVELLKIAHVSVRLYAQSQASARLCSFRNFDL
jgi:hypothetical protein